jgi:hypothetical protein
MILAQRRKRQLRDDSFHGLGVAANLTGECASNIGTGIDLDKVMFAMGPRYTCNPLCP